MSSLTEPATDLEPHDRKVMLSIVVMLLIASTVSWRRGIYFSGEFDPVVVLKGLLSGTALVVAMVLRHRRRGGILIGPRTFIFLTVFLLITSFGGWAAGDAFASSVLAVRVAILAAVMICLVQTYAVEAVFDVLIKVMAATVAVSVLSHAGYVMFTGRAGPLARLVNFLSSGRLEGLIPPLSPNELAFFCAVVILALLWRVVEAKARNWEWAAIAILLGVVWLTGSRTGLATLVVAMIVLLVQTRRVTTPMFLGFVALIPVSVYGLFGTHLVSSLFERGGSQSVTTLSSRTIAWDAALNSHVPGWQEWFGGGLAMKRIPVTGQFWSEQILDSSWVSALVQGGLLGLAIAVLWVVTIIVASFRCDRHWRIIYLALLMFLISRSALESGLFDASPAFLILMLVSVMSEKASRTTGPPVAAAASLKAGTTTRLSGGPAAQRAKILQ